MVELYEIAKADEDHQGWIPMPKEWECDKCKHVNKTSWWFRLWLSGNEFKHVSCGACGTEFLLVNPNEG